MSIHLSTASYADFKTVLANIPETVDTVWYSAPAGGAFFVAAITKLGNFLVTGGQNTGGVPATFGTDFPSAINLPDSNPGGWTVNS